MLIYTAVTLALAILISLTSLSFSSITRSRQAQRNFQLIIITHDTQFVEILGHRIGVEHYYKIGKNIE